MWVNEPALEKNRPLQFKSIGEIAKMQGKRVIDAFLDLVVEEKLDTRFLQAENNIDDEAMTQILTYPNAIVGLGDGGAHVQFHGGYGYTTRLLGEWVRERKVLTLEQAVRKLTFESASAFGIHDRGMLRPGLAADIVIFDPATVKAGKETVVHDFPGRRLAHQGRGRSACTTRSSTARCCWRMASTPARCPAVSCATAGITPTATSGRRQRLTIGGKIHAGPRPIVADVS